MYQPKTGMRCTCRPGIGRDNCPTCEGTGWVIDFAAIRRANETHEALRDVLAAATASVNGRNVTDATRRAECAVIARAALAHSRRSRE